MSNTKAKLLMTLDAPSGYQGRLKTDITSEQWGDLNAIASGGQTQREKLLLDQVHDLKTMLENIVNDAGACDNACYSVEQSLIDTAAAYLKEHP